jgi:hypothetical protein
MQVGMKIVMFTVRDELITACQARWLRCETKTRNIGLLKLNEIFS